MIGKRKSIKEGKTIIRNILIVIIICAIGGYAGFQSKKIISGPQITIQSPSTTSANDGAVDVSGIVKNVSVVTLNDRLIPIDESGQFKEKVLLYPGYNVIKLEATDKFGAHVKKELQMVYNGSDDETTSKPVVEKLVVNKTVSKSDSKHGNATSSNADGQTI